MSPAEVANIFARSAAAPDAGPEEISAWLGEATDETCKFCGREYLLRFEAINGCCWNCSKSYTSKAKDHADHEECPPGNLPSGYRCRGGWHIRDDGAHGTAVDRCHRAVASTRERAVSELHGQRRQVQTFDSFDSRVEVEAWAEVKRWAEECEGRDILALVKRRDAVSNTGCGKSHLLRAAQSVLVKRGQWAEMVSAREVTIAVRSAAAFDREVAGAGEALTRRWERCDVLLLDDLGQEQTAGPPTGSYLVQLLDARGPRPLAFATNLDPDGIAGRYSDALASRLIEGARVPEMRGKDYRGRNVA